MRGGESNNRNQIRTGVAICRVLARPDVIFVDIGSASPAAAVTDAPANRRARQRLQKFYGFAFRMPPTTMP
jgi:hypothetical protein